MRALTLFLSIFGLSAFLSVSQPIEGWAGQNIQLAQTDMAQEAQDWEKIVDSNNPDDYFDFLQKHPNGVFRTTAESQIKRLLKQGGSAPAAAPQTTPPQAASPAPAPAKPEPEPAAQPAAATPAPDQPAAPAIRKIEPVRPAAQPTPPSAPVTVTTPPPATPAAAPQPSISPALEKVTLLRKNTQSEMRRLGCYSGPIDGNWDERSSESLRLFARRKGLVIASTDPTTDILERMLIEKAGICPAPACISTEVLRNGQCMVKACHNGLFLHSDGKCRSQPEKTAVQPAQPQQAETPAPAQQPAAPPAAAAPAAPAVVAPVVVKPAPAPEAPVKATPRPEKTQPAEVKKPPVKKTEPAPRRKPVEKKQPPKPVVREPAPRQEAAPAPRPEPRVVRKRKAKAPCSAAVKGLPEYDHCE